MSDTTTALVEGMARIAKRMYSEKDQDGPWLIGGYLCATDGHLLCASPSNGEGPQAPTRLAATIQRWLVIPQTAPIVVSVASLRRFAAVDVSAPTCQRCAGKSSVTCTRCYGAGTFDCKCDACGDAHTGICDDCEDGQMACPSCSGRETRIGTLLNRKLNTVLLGDILSMLATDERDIAVSLEVLRHATRPNDTGFMFRPVGEGVAWIAFLMPMTDGVTSVVTFEP